MISIHRRFKVFLILCIFSFQCATSEPIVPSTENSQTTEKRTTENGIVTSEFTTVKINQRTENRTFTENENKMSTYPTMEINSTIEKCTIAECENITSTTPTVEVYQTTEQSKSTENENLTSTTPLLKVSQTIENKNTTDSENLPSTTASLKVNQTIENKNTIESENLPSTTASLKVNQTIENKNTTESENLPSTTASLKVNKTIETKNTTESKNLTSTTPSLKVNQTIENKNTIESENLPSTTASLKVNQTIENKNTTESENLTATTPSLKVNQTIENQNTTEIENTQLTTPSVEINKTTEQSNSTKSENLTSTTPSLKVTQTIENKITTDSENITSPTPTVESYHTTEHSNGTESESITLTTPTAELYQTTTNKTYIAPTISKVGNTQTNFYTKTTNNKSIISTKSAVGNGITNANSVKRNPTTSTVEINQTTENSYSTENENITSTTFSVETKQTTENNTTTENDKITATTQTVISNQTPVNSKENEEITLTVSTVGNNRNSITATEIVQTMSQPSSTVSFTSTLPSIEMKTGYHLSTTPINTTTDKKTNFKNPSTNNTIDIKLTFYVQGQQVNNATIQMFEQAYQNVSGFVALRRADGDSKTRQKRQTENMDSKTKQKRQPKNINLILVLAPLKSISYVKDESFYNTILSEVVNITTRMVNKPKLFFNNTLTFINGNSTLQQLKKDIGNITLKFNELLCGIKFDFNFDIQKCLPKCNMYCHHNGYCDYDLLGNQMCRCRNEGNTFFSGKYCQDEAEKLELKAKYIIAIACGIGGLLVAVFITVLCCERRKRRSKSTKGDETFQMTENDTLSYNHPMSLFGRKKTQASMVFGLPEFTYIDNRSYTVIEGDGDTGSTYIYSPSNAFIKDNRSEKSYDNKSYCSDEYAIKRPQISLRADPVYHDFGSRQNIIRPDYPK